MNFKKLITIILCIVLCALACPSVAAETIPNIQVSNAAGSYGDEVTVNVAITNNPGIMSMTFSITYDKDSLEFVSFSRGYISSPTYYDHSDKGYVAFSISESSDKTNIGNILSITFKIKNTATPGNHPITVANHNYVSAGNYLGNCFVNAAGENIIPNIIPGSIKVNDTCNNAGHTFGSWIEVVVPTCTLNGVNTRTCSICGKVEETYIAGGHDFESEWTIDKAATPDEDGIMSRHCTKCDVTIDQITFSYKEIVGDDENDDATNTPDDTTDPDQPVDSETPEDITNPDNTDNQDQPIVDDKPVIDNTEGSKVPQTEVEKFEGFEDVKDSEEETLPPPENPVLNENPPVSNTDDTTPESNNAVANTNNDNSDGKDKSFFSKPIGIITIILAALISVGILAAGVLLIIKRNKQAQEQE